MLDTYSGATRLIFIVGDPIKQVRSPGQVTAMLRAAGQDAVVVPAHVRPADFEVWCAAVARMPNCDGLIITVPHKFAASGVCTTRTDRSKSIGAVNVMRRTDDGHGWHGDMCDGDGYVAGLRQAGCEPAGLRALLVGAGGAGSAIAHALADAPVRALDIVDADADRRDALIGKLQRYGLAAVRAGTPDPTGYDLVINATPMGMRPDDPLPFEAERLSPRTFVGDVVTMPPVPPLLETARSIGCATMTGTAMFEAVRDRIVAFYC